MEPPILCSLAEDSDFTDLAFEFVESLGPEIEHLTEALARRDRAAVAMIAHKLRGAGATLGFEPISDAAAEVERLAQTRAGGGGGGAALEQAAARLASICRRARV